MFSSTGGVLSSGHFIGPDVMRAWANADTAYSTRRKPLIMAISNQIGVLPSAVQQRSSPVFVMFSMHMASGCCSVVSQALDRHWNLQALQGYLKWLDTHEFCVKICRRQHGKKEIGCVGMTLEDVDKKE